MCVTVAEIFCEPCQKSFNSQFQANQHFNSMKHKDISQSQCSVCELGFNTNDETREHFISKEHRKALAKKKNPSSAIQPAAITTQKQSQPVKMTIPSSGQPTQLPTPIQKQLVTAKSKSKKKGKK